MKDLSVRTKWELLAASLAMSLISICMSLSMLSCAAKAPATLRPGALNAFDSATFNTLVTIQAALEEASKEASNLPTIKPEVNKAIDLYNAAEISYKAYHEALEAGKPTDQASLDKLIRDLSVAAASVIDKLKPLKPIPVPPAAFLFAGRFA